MKPNVVRRMGPRLGVLAMLLAVMTTALGCSAAGSAGPPSTEPASTPTAPTSTDQTPTSETGGLPLIGCVDPHPGLAAILAVDPSQRPACFGGSNLTFRAVVVAAEVDCVPVQVQPTWMWCPPVAFLTAPATASRPGSDDDARGTGAAWAATGPIAASAAVPTLEMYAAPGSGLGRGQFADGTKVQVIGHFDDPAAATCRVLAVQPGWRAPTLAEVVLACRQAFVAVAVVATSA